MERISLPDGSVIERNFRKDENGHRMPYGSWFWRVYDPDRRPKRKRVNLRTKSKSAAFRKALDMVKVYELGTLDPWKKTSTADNCAGLHEACELFLERQARKGRSTATIKSDKDLLRRFERHLPAGLPLVDVTREYVESFVHARKPIPKSRPDLRIGEERSVSTKERMLATLRHFFEMAILEEWVKENPAAGIELPNTGTHRRDHLTATEEEVVLSSIQRRESETGVSRGWLKDWIRFGTHVGLRPSEQLALRWEAVNLQERTVKVGLGHATKTKGSVRVMPLSQVPLQVLTRRASDLLAEGLPMEEVPFAAGELPDTSALVGKPVFTGATGDAISREYVGKQLKRFAKEAGVKKAISLYFLRHSFGTRAAAGGMPLATLAHCMGTSIDMIMKHYAHYSPESAAKHLDRIF